MSESRGPEPPDDEIREYARGELRVRRGRVNPWLLVLYVCLAVWGVYYLVAFWGGLGPGLAVGR